MKKFLLYLAVVAVVLAGLLRLSLEAESAQSTALHQFTQIAMQQNAQGVPQPDSLQAFVCGSSSPIPAQGRAQACIAIMTPQHFYIVDSGAGSTANLMAGRLPLNRLQGVFLTHFHSDHIAEIAELNLNSWVQGRPEQLQIFGPKGVKKITSSLNHLYELDSQYRVDHHGEELLNPKLSQLRSKRIKPGVVLQDGDLTVTAYQADHSPIDPAVGYRFDYRGRSIVVSGDSLVTEHTRAITKNVDLVLHDALSLPIVTSLANAAEVAGADRNAKIFRDIMDYHATTDDVIALKDQVQMVALYHLVPAPGNVVMKKIFERNLPEHYLLAEDMMWFELPATSEAINVIDP